MRRISVHASTDYDVLVEHGLLRQCGSLLAGAAVTRHFVIVTDDTVDELYRKDLLHALGMAGCKAECFVFPHGEASKCSGTLLKLYDFLCESGITRSDCLIALGGSPALRLPPSCGAFVTFRFPPLCWRRLTPP